MPQDLRQNPLKARGKSYTKKNDKISARRIMQAKRMKLVQEAVGLRLAGYQYYEIGKMQNCDKATAFRRVQEGLSESAASLERDAASLRTIELERLELMWKSIWAKAQAGDIEAIDRCMRITAQRARLQGLDVNQVELVFDDSAVATLAQIIARRVDARTAALIQSDMAAFALMQGSSNVKALPEGIEEGQFQEIDNNAV